MMNEIFEKFANMPADFWILSLAILIFSFACFLLLLARKNRYKNYDKDGRLFEPVKIDLGLDAIEPAHHSDGFCDGLGNEIDHH